MRGRCRLPRGVRHQPGRVRAGRRGLLLLPGRRGLRARLILLLHGPEPGRNLLLGAGKVREIDPAGLLNVREQTNSALNGRVSKILAQHKGLHFICKFVTLVPSLKSPVGEEGEGREGREGG